MDDQPPAGLLTSERTARGGPRQRDPVGGLSTAVWSGPELGRNDHLDHSSVSDQRQLASFPKKLEYLRGYCDAVVDLYRTLAEERGQLPTRSTLGAGRPPANVEPTRVLADVFGAIGWKTWRDIGLAMDSAATIGQVGPVTVLDASPPNHAPVGVDIFFGSHSDYPDLPLVVKCARRGVVIKGRRPGYWSEPTARPPDIPLDDAQARHFEPRAYQMASEIALARLVSGQSHVVPLVDAGHSGLINTKWHVYAVYPYFPAGDVEGFVGRRRLSRTEFQSIGRSLLAALRGTWMTLREYGDSDMSLSNMFLDARGEAWLSGSRTLLSPLGRAETRSPRAIEFCAPEVLQPGTAPRCVSVRAAAADAYRIGAILYTLKAGNFPHWDKAQGHRVGQRVEERELAKERSVGSPTEPADLGAEAWSELSSLLSPDPYRRVGLDDVGLREVFEVAKIRGAYAGLMPEESLIDLDEREPDLLPRLLGENVLGAMSRLLAALDGE